MMKIFTQSNDGFAMLFTVLVISIILTIALGISDTTFKQTILSSLAADSQLAFYQADSGVECGMYYETQGQFGAGTTPDTPGSSGTALYSINCGSTNLALDTQDSYTDYLVYKEDLADNVPCFAITFDRASDASVVTVSSRGYSTCGTSARQVERGLSVSYPSGGGAATTSTGGTTPSSPSTPSTPAE